MFSTVRVRSLFGTCVLATLLTVGAMTSVAADAAAKPSACKASMSVPNPKQRTTTVVRVSQAGAGARITTVAHYKSKNTTKVATASSKGTASVPYDVSTATKNYRVNVVVTAVKGGQHWSCLTAYVPR